MSNYVDQQPGTGIKNFTMTIKPIWALCGIDIFLWSFSDMPMDTIMGENIAAADGQIIGNTMVRMAEAV